MNITDILFAFIMMGGLTAITAIIFRSPMRKIKAEVYKQQKLKELNAPGNDKKIEARLAELETTIQNQEKEIETLTADAQFVKKLLDNK